MPTPDEGRPTLRSMRRLTDVSPATARPVTAREGADLLTDRVGFAERFLRGAVVPLPVPTGERTADVTPIPGRDDGRLDYTHFSLVMSRSRRLAMFTALNLDGSALVGVPRDDNWRLDPRLAPAQQIDNALYAHNPLDRGHLVRRTAVNWGAEAEQANADTFHFTNCTPQMAGFNQQTLARARGLPARARPRRCPAPVHFYRSGVPGGRPSLSRCPDPRGLLEGGGVHGRERATLGHGLHDRTDR